MDIETLIKKLDEEDVGCAPEETTNLIRRVVSEDNILKAQKRLRKNMGIIKWEIFDAYWEVNKIQIEQQIVSGTYMPRPVRRQYINKEAGKRPLGIPEPEDRLIQQAILQVISPLIDPVFSEFSYGYREGKDAHKAISKAIEYVIGGYEYIVDLDIEKFFDNINIDVLMNKLTLPDIHVKRLIGRFIRVGIIENGIIRKKRHIDKGIHQGSPLSPLLANVYFDTIDKCLEERGYKFIRYADDRAPRRLRLCDRNCRINVAMLDGR